MAALAARGRKSFFAQQSSCYFAITRTYLAFKQELK
jgi:hypothetical protein